jgi:Fic family protein
MNVTQAKKEIEIWERISVDEKWTDADISIFDDLAPSWYKKRAEFKNDNEGYEEFLTKLKRQHAIETGVVERLYDLTEGITQTLIKDGFIESYISHSETNIPPKKLMQYLHDHFEAMDFVFDFVKSERPLSISFIKGLHQLITQHQDYTEAADSLGRVIQVELLKGEFKQRANNPKRKDDTVFMYCPPVHVQSEMENLLSIYENLIEENANPIIISAWVHHAFTQIHPFQDGNGRIARLLASLILIKNGLLPFTVNRNGKTRYINALEDADNGNPQLLISFFAQEQKKSIELALNFKAEKKVGSISELATMFTEKISDRDRRLKEKRTENHNDNREKIFDVIYDLLGEIKDELKSVIPKNRVDIAISSWKPNTEKSHYHTNQIIMYANHFDYFFNRDLPRAWFQIGFNLKGEKRYDLILSVHHYGFDDDAIAIGSFLQYNEKTDKTKTTTPISIEPFTLSLENISEKRFDNMKEYINDVIKVGLSTIIRQIG